MTSQNAKTIRITAGRGTLNSALQKAVISEDVHLTATSGFWLKTNNLEVDLKQGVASTNNMFQGITGLGTINAGKLVIKMIADDQQIIFTNGVRLIYYPELN